MLLVLMPVAMFLTPALAAEIQLETAIVWVADISSSILEIDPQRLWSDAVSLGVDIAPANTKVAFIAVNSAVTEQTPLLDASNADNRAEIKKAARNVAITGYTDFGAGLSAALELLGTSSAKDKHIFFTGDFSESGFMFSSGDYSSVADEMAALTEQLADSGIKVHLLFMREPTLHQELVALWEDLAVETGGEFISIDDPAAITKTVEILYFQKFTYNQAVTTSINTSDIAQDIPIRLPAFELDRVRIYISSDVPMRGMQARADGVELSFSETRSYFMVDLSPPLPRMVTLSLPPNGSSGVRVYLLADGGMTLVAAADSEAEIDSASEVFMQKTAIALSPLNSKAPLFEGSLPPDVNWEITVFKPDGQSAVVDADYLDGSFIYNFYPKVFGTYLFSISIESQGIRLSAEAIVGVPEIELPVIVPPDDEPEPLPPLPEPYDYSLWIALAIGLLLIVAAVLFASRRRKRANSGAPIPAPLVYPAPMPKKEPAPAGTFSGKLDIYGVLVEGGKVEIPAMSVRLEAFARSRSVTLETALEQSGVPYRYPAAAHISLSPGQDYTLEIKNSSDAVIYCGGEARRRGQQAALSYGQKIRVVFEDEVSEYDIFYHNAAKMAVSGDHIQVEAKLN